ncbi:MAG: D-Ala-D-Ala carboxypeptidase family metallohydrolase [Muribaculaceae bacterium]|nr:D-Ala-D-Ala carboxypeptidase family metallohydrolase [Muribaculaceae bacterium]
MNYFTIDELTQSCVAEKYGIANNPDESVVNNMKRLISQVLNPAREAIKIPIKVNSGFRSAELNKAVGGAVYSYHLSGRAADLTTGTKAGNRRLYKILQHLPHAELINEKDATWIHVAL